MYTLTAELAALPYHIDPPVSGKRYLSILTATNHNFSRGTIVSVLHSKSFFGLFLLTNSAMNSIRAL